MAVNSALLDAVKNAKNKYSRSDNKHLKPAEGRNVYRIVIPTDATKLGPNGEFWADLGQHWIKTALKGKPICVVGSRDICFGEPCAVGIAYEAALGHAESAGYDEDTVALIKEMKPAKSVLFQAVNRTTDNKSQTVEILELRPSAAQQILDLYMQYLEEGQDMFDLAAGVDIVVTKSGKGLQTEYTVNVKPGASAPLAKEAAERCINLREHIEREYFKGEENKAILTLQNIAGIQLPRLAATPSAAALSAPSTPAASGNSASAPATPAPAKQNAFQAAAGQVADEAPDTVSAADLDSMSSDDLDDVLSQLNDLG
jgi:hypothetical protein